MKTFTLSILFVFTMSILNAQSHKVPYYNWSDVTTFQLSPAPIIKGNTLRSDSLATAIDAKQVYEYNGEFYLIDTWADYYLWYSTKYWFDFEMPELYQFYYHNQDDYNMVRFIANNFKGSYYPTRISVSVKDEPGFEDEWEKRILANNSTKESKYIKRLNRNAKQNKDVTRTYVSMDDFDPNANSSQSVRRTTSTNMHSSNKSANTIERPTTSVHRNTRASSAQKTTPVNYRPQTKSTTTNQSTRSAKTLPTKK